MGAQIFPRWREYLSAHGRMEQGSTGPICKRIGLGKMPTTFRGWTMSNQSVVNANEPEVSHAHRPMVLSFSGQADRTEERWSPREDATLAKENPSLNSGRRALFEQVVLPHLDSAYNLARWLTGNDHNAEDV